MRRGGAKNYYGKTYRLRKRAALARNTAVSLLSNTRTDTTGAGGFLRIAEAHKGTNPKTAP